MSDAGPTEADPKLTEKQQRVLEAALEVFAERGFHGASTSEIAKRAGVAEGTLFKQYRTKKELFLGALTGVFARTAVPILLAEVRDILRAPHDTPEALLRALFRNRLEFARRHGRVVRVAMQELPFHPEVREIIRVSVTKELAADVAAVVRRFQQAGLVREAPVASIVRIVFGTLFSFLVTRMLLMPDYAWDEEREIELMVSVLATGLAPPRRA